MDDTPAKNPPGDNINKIDLSALEAFEFGTQWTDSGGDTQSDRGDPSRRERSRGPGRETGPGRRDRRPPRQHHERPSTDSGGGPAAGSDPHGSRDRRGFPRGREPRSGAEFRGGGQGGPRSDRSGHFERGPRGHSGPPRPYQSPIFELTFYPDDHGFTALVKAMRSSCRTYELFEIARLILGKPERCVVVFRRRKEASAANEATPLFIAVPDGVPFPTEEEAINHVLERHLDKFFTIEEVEVEPPKGSFPFVNRCPITKTLLGPPNYHRYAQILQQHYATNGIRIPFEKYKASIEVVREEEAVNAWLESMKKGSRYTYQGTIEGEPGVFENLEDARAFVLRTCRERIVRAAESARVAAKNVESVPQSEAARAMHGAVEMQQRFPLDTANALRGRLRRENFHIFKRGAKGVTYVCSVRRKFRQPGQLFSDSINRLITFLDENPLCPVNELPTRFLGFEMPHAPPPATPGEEAAEESSPPAAPAVPEPTAEQKAALNRLLLDLRWLVTEGYVAEYSDGRLTAHPVMVPEVPKPKPERAAEAPVDTESGEQTSPSEAAAAPAAAQPEAGAESDAPPPEATNSSEVASTETETPAPPAEQEASGDSDEPEIPSESEHETGIRSDG